MKIADIRIGERHRKDLGDIEGLARSMNEVGLLHPVVVRADGALIAGERRIAAARMLGWEDIPATVVDLADILLGEHAENTQRKDFTVTEALDMAAALEPLEREKARERMMAGTPSEKFTQGRAPQSLDRVASAVGMSRPTLLKAREVAEAAQMMPEDMGDLPEMMDSTSVDRAHKEMRNRLRQHERAVLAETVAVKPMEERWQVHVADMREWNTDQRFDFIITDPPYPREYLPLYGDLARRAAEWLKPDGLLIAMCGQSYLDQIMAIMGAHLAYYWTGAYMTPGAPTPLRARQVNTTWKPILIYQRPGSNYKGKIFGDVWVSEGPDKNHHGWGQSESGMLALIKQIVLPGQSVMDPFCGAGTTGVAALRHGCTFLGLDLDEDAVQIARDRLAQHDEEAA